MFEKGAKSNGLEVQCSIRRPVGARRELLRSFAVRPTGVRPSPLLFSFRLVMKQFDEVFRTLMISPLHIKLVRSRPTLMTMHFLPIRSTYLADSPFYRTRAHGPTSRHETPKASQHQNHDSFHQSQKNLTVRHPLRVRVAV